MIGDDAPHDSQPEPGPGPDIFGRVERLEDVDLRHTRYPRSVVDDLDDYTRAFHVRPDGDASASVHSVYGVVDQVGPYLVQLAAVPPSQPGNRVNPLNTTLQRAVTKCFGPALHALLVPSRPRQRRSQVPPLF